METKWIGAALAASSMVGTASAAVVSAWDFNKDVLAASQGSGEAVTVGGASYTFAAGAPSDPGTGGVNHALNTSAYAAQGTLTGEIGLELRLSTVGWGEVSLTWEQRASASASRFMQVQYALDGKAFTSEGLAGGGVVEVDASSVWVSKSVDLSSISGIANNPDLALRIVAVFAPGTGGYQPVGATSSYSTAGTQRFDMMRIEGTAIPSPAGASVLGLAALTAVRRRVSRGP